MNTGIHRSREVYRVTRRAWPQDNNVTEQDDKKAFFSQSIQHHMASLYSVARRLTRNSADAEDLIAEAATRAWSSFDSLEDRSHFRPWIFRILHNCYVSDYRKKSIRPAETAYDELSTANDDSEIACLLTKQPDEFLAWWANPEREVVNQMLGKDLMDAIESLPESFRMVVVLINVEGLSYDEAAEVLGVSPGTIRSRMNRGRTLLQKSLWRHAQDTGLISTYPAMESRS
jgi:RNA polymerase sigma-70 factor (ECF subfamily)